MEERLLAALASPAGDAPTSEGRDDRAIPACVSDAPGSALANGMGPGDDDDDEDDKPGEGGGNIDPDDEEGYDDDDDEDDDEEEPLQVSPCRCGDRVRRGQLVALHHSVVRSRLRADLRVSAGCPPRAAVPRQSDHRFLISRFILPAIRV
jgi:hypothetical protein